MSAEIKAVIRVRQFPLRSRGTSSFLRRQAVSLPPKAFEILLILIKSNGRLLTKDEMMQKVWPDSFCRRCQSDD